jgi:putative flippase GtrA
MSLKARATGLARAALIEPTAHHPKHVSVLIQLFRYAIAGGVSALVYSAVFLALTTFYLGDRLATLAVFPAFAVSLGVSFLGHSRWSFAGHGTREKGVAQPARFAAVQATGLLLNIAFTFLITVMLRGPSWAALIPSLTVTPITTFLVHRFWVFR